MSAYCFFDIQKVTDGSKMEEYRKDVTAVVERFGGRYVVLGGKLDLVEGDWRPTTPVLIQFPSLEQAHNWYNSGEYKKLKELRLSATKTNAVFMEGL
jgi:uncharacterized protein (DUF1330 family)